MAGGQGGEGKVALEGDLFAGLLELFGGFVLVPDLLVVFEDAVGDGDIGLVRAGVKFQVVELKEDAHFVGGGEFGVDTGADFVGVEDEESPGRFAWWGRGGSGRRG